MMISARLFNIVPALMHAVLAMIIARFAWSNASDGIGDWPRFLGHCGLIVFFAYTAAALGYLAMWRKGK